MSLEIRLAELHQDDLLRSKCFLELLILLEHRIRDAGASRRLNFCSKISGELLELTHTGCTMGIVDAVENPVGFHSTTSAVSFSFLSASADERLASMHEPSETVGILLDVW